MLERKMIRLLLGSAVLMVCLGFVTAKLWAKPDGCPVVVTCNIDGEGMMEEETYVNGIHISKKYGHTHQGSHGPEHHYVIIQCQ